VAGTKGHHVPFPFSPRHAQLSPAYSQLISRHPTDVVGVGSTQTARMARMTNHEVPLPLFHLFHICFRSLHNSGARLAVLHSFSFMRIYLVLYSLPPPA